MTTIAVFLMACVIYQPTDWPQFRGQFGSGESAAGLPPVAWSLKDNSNIAWQKELPGRGVSGAIVVGDHVLVTSSAGNQQDQLYLFSIQADSGEIQWQRTFWGTGRTACHPLSAMSAPTPASDGQRVVALFASNDVVCLDLQGNLQWVRSLETEHPLAFDDRGLASSVLIAEGVAIVQVATQGASFVTALDLDTGQTNWTHELSKLTNWATPGATSIGGQTWIVVQSADELVVLDARTGKVRWQHKAEGALIPSPVVVGTSVYLPAEGLLKLELSQESDKVDVRWKSNALGPNSASPVLSGPHIFVMRPPNVLTCGDISNGKVLWKKRLTGEQFWATPAIVQDRLYIASADGKVHVVDTKDRGTILGTSEMDEEILGSPALSGNALYLRGVKHLWKIVPSVPEASGTSLRSSPS